VQTGRLNFRGLRNGQQGVLRALTPLDDPETTQRDERAFIFRLMQVHSGAEICNLGTMVRSGN
jgi:hypothetical protein